jgi:hypothetical protein
MSEGCKELTFDAIDVLKGLVKSNLWGIIWGGVLFGVLELDNKILK